MLSMIIGGKTRLVIFWGMIVMALLYMNDYKKYDNTNLKKNIMTLEQEVKKMEENLNRITEIEKIHFFNKWYVLFVVSQLGFKDIEYNRLDNMVVFKLSQGNTILDTYMEFQKCQKAFNDFCLVRKIYPFEIGIYVEQ